MSGTRDASRVPHPVRGHAGGNSETVEPGGRQRRLPGTAGSDSVSFTSRLTPGSNSKCMGGDEGKGDSTRGGS
eukprot:765797-Hanusia_phi.AAC.2